MAMAGSGNLLRQLCGVGWVSAGVSSVATQHSIRSYHVARLASRGVLSMSGLDCVQFLQGMTTNDVKPLEQAGAGPIYTVLLTAKGKYLHDLFAYSIPGDEPQLLLDVDTAGANSALAWLKKYKLRRKLQISDVSSQYSVWAAFEGNLQAGGAGQWRQDPRIPELGLRGIFDSQQLPPPPSAGGGSSSRKQQAAGMSVMGEEAFQRWRYQLGIAEGDKDMPTGEVAPLECNLDALSGISYSKGCYIGQERNSYTHYRGIIRKRMMPVLLPGVDQETRLPCPLPITGTGQSSSRRAAAAGILTNHAGDLGMAYVRLSAALAPDAKLTVLVGDREQQVVPQRPSWWPADWGREEETADLPVVQ